MPNDNIEVVCQYRMVVAGVRLRHMKKLKKPIIIYNNSDNNDNNNDNNNNNCNNNNDKMTKHMWDSHSTQYRTLRYIEQPKSH